jgi:hypothetical protein
MHPGGVHTPLFGKGGGLQSLLASLYMRFAGRTPEQGADTIVWLASDSALEAKTGAFWYERREIPCRFRDPETEERLWQLCERMTSAR